jgi:hypothetical protein
MISQEIAHEVATILCVLLPFAITIAAHSAEPVAKVRLEFSEIPIGKKKIDLNMAVNLDTVMLSPDGKRLAYVSERQSVLDGDTEGKQYDGISESLFFSPDSKRLAYAAWRGEKMLVVVDGVEGQHYDEIEDAVLENRPILGGIGDKRSPIRTLPSAPLRTRT